MHLGPGTERDSASNPTWPSWKEYDLVECGGDRQGGACNVDYGATNTQTGPHHFDGDLTQWHVFGCELFDNGVRYLLDGKVVKELTGANVMSNHIHRLGIQLDVGRQPGERRRAGVRRLGQSCQGGSVSMNRHGPIGTVPDLGAVRARQQEKAAGPDYDPGTPEFAMQVRVALGPNAAPSFTDALDRAALILDNDGWAIERVSQCAMLGMDEQGYGFFQVVVTAKRTENHYEQ